METRTAAVAYSNGTTIPVAKIEGGPTYKAEMRRLLLETLEPDQESTIFVTIYFTLLSCLRFLNLVEQSVKISPLKGMLSALKVSTEVFLEEDIQSVETALPATKSYSTQGNPQTQYLDDVLNSIGLARTNEHPARSSLATIYANNITSLPSTGKLLPSFILHLSYSCSALIITLENLEVGLLEITKTTARLDLGADSIRSYPHYWRAVESEMKRFLTGITVRDVVVSGDRVWEEAEVSILMRRVLGKKVVPGRSLGRGGGGADPVWAGVLGVARMAISEDFEDGEIGIWGVGS